MDSEMQELWESFWRDLSVGSKGAFWDARPEFSLTPQLPVIARYFDPTLPMVDLGCGNGTQTRVLADHAGEVIGVDIAESALRTARRVNSVPNVTYRQLDILDAEAVRQLADQTGEANVYVRGVIHQLPVVTRLFALKSIMTLTGRRGHVFDNEPSPAAHMIINELIKRSGGPPPRLADLARHFRDGLRFTTLDEPDAETLFGAAGLRIVEHGELVMPTADLHGGIPLTLPSTYVVARAADDG